MLAVPALTAVTTPVLELTVALAVLLLDHVPVPDALARVVVPPGKHKLAKPVFALGIALTVTMVVLAQPSELV